MIDSLLPNTGSTPKFAQLYIYDTDNKVSNKISAIRYLYSKYNCKFNIYFYFQQLLNLLNYYFRSRDDNG